MQSIDSIIKVLTAAKEGKEIEYTSRYSDGEWASVKKPETWEYDFSSFVYRIKPTKCYRPYKNAKEFTDALWNHKALVNKTDYIYHYPISYNDELITICDMNNDTTHYMKISYESLKDTYEWDNGDICGTLSNE